MRRRSEFQPGDPSPSSGSSEPEDAARKRRLELTRAKLGGGGASLGAERLTVAYQERERAGGVAGKRHLEKYPEDKEGAEILKGFTEFLENSRKLRRSERATASEKLRLVRELTEFNVRWTGYVHKMTAKRQVLEAQWKSLESLARSRGESSEYYKSRAGILTQVATLKIFDALNLDHHLSTPSEDAYHKIDLWVEDAAVQIKTGHVQKAQVIASTTADTMHAMIESHGQEVAASAGAAEDMDFRLKLREYGREIGKPDLTGIFILIPAGQIVDKVTGKPSQELINDVREELRKFMDLPEDTEEPGAEKAAA
jgi:hypothetical protein